MTHLYNLPEPLDVTLVTTESRYEIPTKARWVYVLGYAGGGGGGGGASGAINTQRGGGAGGQAGLSSWMSLPTVMCPGGALWIVPGAGGQGGASDTVGGDGTSTQVFVTDKYGLALMGIYGGKGGNPGTTTSGGSVVNTGTDGPNIGFIFVSWGGSATERTGTNGGSTGTPGSLYFNNGELGGSGGSGGAGCASGSYTASSGAGIQTIQYSVENLVIGPTIGGGAGNATQGGNGVDGYYQQLQLNNFNGLIRSYGGTGGGNSNSGTGGRGGHGAIGAGGGGGGGGLIGGAGGNGGSGYAIISWW